MSAIVGLFTELLSPGGVQRAGRHVAAVAANFAFDHGTTVRYLSLNDPQGLHVVRIGHLEFSVSGYDRSKTQFIMAALRAAGRKPPLAIALHPHLAPIVWAIKLRDPKCRSIIFTHGVEVWKPLKWPRGPALRRADIVVAPSADTIQHLVADQGISPAKIRKLHWGLDPDFEASLSDGKELPLPAGFPQSGRILLTIGRWDKAESYKGADTLISVLPRILNDAPDIFLVLIGDGDDRPRLEELARKLNVSEHCCFLGGLPPNQLSACFAQCDVFALPSRGEGFGFVFLEAMAHAKPVIGGAHGGIAEIVDDGKSGLLVPYGDTEKLTQAVQFLFGDAARAKEMGEKGRERVNNSFSFEKFQAGLIQILNTVPTELP